MREICAALCCNLPRILELLRSMGRRETSTKMWLKRFPFQMAASTYFSPTARNVPWTGLASANRLRR